MVEKQTGKSVKNLRTDNALNSAQTISTFFVIPREFEGIWLFVIRHSRTALLSA